MAVTTKNRDWVPPKVVNPIITYPGFWGVSAKLDFFARPKKPNPLTPTYGRADITYANKQIVNSLGARAWHTPTVRYEDEGAGSDEGLKNRALSRLVQGDLELLATAFELPETIEMITNAAKSAVAASKKFRKGDIIGGLKELGTDRRMSRRDRRRVKEYGNRLKEQPKLKRRTVSGTWLEANFGWRPFINDLENSLSAWTGKFYEGQSIRRSATNFEGLRVRRSREEVGFVDGVVPGLQAGTSYTVGGWVSNPDIVNYTRLGLNPLAGLWAILPYSWLVDYFYDVTSFINAGISTAGYRNVWACKTQTTTSKGFNPNGVATYTRLTIIRTVDSMPALPTWIAPTAAGLGISQQANIIAVILQKLSR